METRKSGSRSEEKRLELERRKRVAEILTGEITRLGWTSARLARESGAYPSATANLIAQKKNLGPALAKRIASALGYPEDTLLEAAGLKSIPEGGKESALRRRFLKIFDDLGEGDQEALLAQAEGLRVMRRNKDNAEEGRKQNAHPKPNKSVKRK